MDHLESCLFGIFIREIKGSRPIIHASQNGSRKILKVITRTMEDREDAENEGTVETRCTTPVLSCPGELNDVNLAEEMWSNNPVTGRVPVSKDPWNRTQTQRAPWPPAPAPAPWFCWRLVLPSWTAATPSIQQMFTCSRLCNKMFDRKKILSNCHLFLKRGSSTSNVWPLLTNGVSEGPEFWLYTMRSDPQTAEGQRSAMRVLRGQRSGLKITPFALYFPDAFI